MEPKPPAIGVSSKAGPSTLPGRDQNRRRKPSPPKLSLEEEARLPGWSIALRSGNDNWAMRPSGDGYGDDEGLTFTKTLSISKRTAKSTWTGTFGFEALAAINREAQPYHRVDSFRGHLTQTKVFSVEEKGAVWIREFGAGVHAFGRGGLGLAIQNGWHSITGDKPANEITYADELKIGPAVSAGIVRRAKVLGGAVHEASARGYASLGEQRVSLKNSLTAGRDLYVGVGLELGWQNMAPMMNLGYRDGAYINPSIQLGFESKHVRISYEYTPFNSREVTRKDGGTDAFGALALAVKF